METNLLGQKSTKAVRSVFSAGINYTLPMLIIAQAEIFTDGNFRLQFECKDIPVSKTLTNEFNVEYQQRIYGRIALYHKTKLWSYNPLRQRYGIDFGVNLNY